MRDLTVLTEWTDGDDAAGHHPRTTSNATRSHAVPTSFALTVRAWAGDRSWAESRAAADGCARTAAQAVRQQLAREAADARQVATPQPTAFRLGGPGGRPLGASTAWDEAGAPADERSVMSVTPNRCVHGCWLLCRPWPFRWRPPCPAVPLLAPQPHLLTDVFVPVAPRVEVT